MSGTGNRQGEAGFRLADLARLRAPLPGKVTAAIAFGASLSILAIWNRVAIGAGQPHLLPAPSVVLGALGGMFADQNLAWHAGVSILRVWGAFLLATVMAVPIGMMISAIAASAPRWSGHRLHPLPAGAGAGAALDHLVRRGRGNQDLPALARHLLQLVLMVADDMPRVPHEYFEIAATIGARRTRSSGMSLPGHAAQPRRQPAHHARLVLDLPDRRRNRRRQFRPGLRHLGGPPLHEDARGDGRRGADRPHRPAH